MLAVGNPFGLGGTVTAGIVSALARNIGGPYDFMQIDAAVNHGNSGGPSFNLEGDVVGVNTAIYSPTGGNVGIAFAVPADTVKRVVEQLEKGGSVSRGWLGVKIQDVDKDLAGSLGLKEPKGAVISEVLADGPAAGAGLKVEDAIVQVDSKKIDDPPRSAAHDRRSSGQGHGRRQGLARQERADGEGQARHLSQQGRGRRQDNDRSRRCGQGYQRNVDLKQLGITLKPATAATRKASSSAEVDPNSDAARRACKEGDVILKAGDATVSSPQDVVRPR